MSPAPESSHLGRLAAQARPAGSTATHDALDYCRGVLHNAGFNTNEQAFEYSAFPGSWATPVAGIVAGLAAIGLFMGRFVPALLVASLSVLVLTFVVLAYSARRIIDLPFMRRRGVNLQAMRGADAPTVWLVAHIDSKWQPVSMIARVIGVVGTTIGLVASITLAFTPGPVDMPVAGGVLLFTWLASTPLMLSIVAVGNTGALDNASGVAAVLEAAERIPRTARVGVLITDAEELALAGARAWARTMTPGIALNCDSIDDEGETTLMYSRSKPASLVSRMSAAAQAQGEPLRVMRLIPGILTDAVALADAGWETVTLSRGDIRTLMRIHTSRDTLETMRGTRIASAAAILARTATELG